MTKTLRPIAVLVAVAVLLVAETALAQEREPVAQVVALSGDGAVIRTTERVPLGVGLPIHRDDRIVTRANARVQVRFADGSSLVVGERSEIEIRDYAGGREESSTTLSLVYGIVRATVPDGSVGGFEIWTNAAVAAVRHTEWIVLRQSDRSAVFAADGSVSVTIRDQARAVVLNQGEGIDILADGEIRGPNPWGAGRVTDVRNATRDP